MSDRRAVPESRSLPLPRLWAGIVDDHPVYRLGLMEALRAAPEIGIAWSAGSPEEALDRLQTTSIDVLITDLNFSGRPDGVDLIASVRARWPSIAVAVISALADESMIVAATAAGADVFLNKDLPAPEMVKRIVMLGLPTDRSRASDGASRIGTLSRREMQVLAEMRRGSTNREIARALGISTTTVNKHVHRILLKLNARNRSQAVSRSGLN